MLQVFTKQIDDMLSIAEENYHSLEAARPRPSVLDDYTVGRVSRVFTDMHKDLWFYDEQLQRWSKERLSSKEKREVDRLIVQMEKVHATVSAILDLAEKLKGRTIEKVLAMDDAELAVKTLTDPQWPGVDELLKGATQGLEKLFVLARQVEPQMVHRFTTQPANNPLEALLLMVDEIMGLLQGKELPVPDEVRVELARLLALEFDFSAKWPYTRKQMQAAMTPGHPDLRPNIPDEDILVIAREVERLLLTKLKEERVEFRDPTQAGMTVVYLTHETLFGKSQVLGGDAHGLHHIARVVVSSYQFSPAFPYSTEQIRVALKAHFQFQP